MGMFKKSDKKDSNFKILEELIDDDFAWVKYTKAYNKTTELFKLVKKDGNALAVARNPREKVPF